MQFVVLAKLQLPRYWIIVIVGAEEDGKEESAANHEQGSPLQNGQQETDSRAMQFQGVRYADAVLNYRGSTPKVFHRSSCPTRDPVKTGDSIFIYSDSVQCPLGCDGILSKVSEKKNVASCCSL